MGGGYQRKETLPLKDGSSWALAPLGIFVLLADGCRQHQHFKTSQAVMGDMILPACSCYIKLGLSLSDGGADAGERNPSSQGQLKDLRVGCYCTKKTVYVPKSLRNITLHLCFNWCVRVLRALTCLRTLIHSCWFEWMQFKVCLEKRRGAKIQEGTRKFNHQLQLSFAKVMLLWIVNCSFLKKCGTEIVLMTNDHRRAL